uniref:Uncharacterized protein n=1 Tax=Oryza brachyantha TaxID=4533 RepID=J3M1T3_ORYBR
MLSNSSPPVLNPINHPGKKKKNWDFSMMKIEKGGCERGKEKGGASQSRPKGRQCHEGIGLARVERFFFFCAFMAKAKGEFFVVTHQRYAIRKRGGAPLHS